VLRGGWRLLLPSLLLELVPEVDWRVVSWDVSWCLYRLQGLVVFLCEDLLSR
jgi:hypothetical protein